MAPNAIATTDYVKDFVNGVESEAASRINALEMSKQTKVMFSPITVSGEEEKTVEGAISAINTLTAENKTAINNLNDIVGSINRNLYEGSPSFDGYGPSGRWIKQSETHNGHEVYKRNSDDDYHGLWWGMYKRLYVQPGIYTFSVSAKTDIPNTCVQTCIRINGSSTPLYPNEIGPKYLDTDWTTLSHTFEVYSAGYIEPRIELSGQGESGGLYISEYKLEKGPVATPYEPYYPQLAPAVNTLINYNTDMGNYVDNPAVTLVPEKDKYSGVLGNATVRTTFEPIQEGSGDPSPENVRPIRGTNSVKITRCGKNLCSGIEQGVRHNDGHNSSPTSGDSYHDIRARSVNIIYLKSGTYTLNATSSVSNEYISAQVSYRANNIPDGDNPVISTSEWTALPYTFTVSSDSYISLIFGNYTSTSIIASNITVQLESGPIPTAYEPYNRTDYLVDLNGTRYGGQIDISDTGECWLTASWKSITLNLSDADEYDLLEGYIRYLFRDLATDISAEIPNYSLCDVAGWNVDYAGLYTHFYIDTDTQYSHYGWTVVTLPASHSVTSFQIVYPLANPIKIKLKDTPIQLLDGVNTIYSDTGKNVLVKTNGISSAIGALTTQVNDLVNTIKNEKIIYGFRIDPSESDSSECVSYLADAIGMTPAYMDSTAFNYGSWENAFFMPKPCMLNYDGTVAYYLDPNDYTKKADGTASDISDFSFPGNAMMEFPLIWYKWVQGSNSGEGYFYVANYQVDGTYKCYSNLDCNGNVIEHFYMPIYNGVTYDGKLRSLSGKKMTGYTTAGYNSSATYSVGDTVNYEGKMYRCTTAVSSAEAFDSNKWTQVAFSGWTSGEEEITQATANNTTSEMEWYIDQWCDRVLIQGLLVLMSKSIDTQGKFGRGIDEGSDSAKENYVTGSLNNKGLFYGSTSNGSTAIKVFGMENYWALQWRRVAGLIGSTENGNNTYLYKMTASTADGTTVKGYNTTGSGYLTVSGRPSEHNWLKKMQFGQFGALPLEVGSYSTQYYKDHYWTGTGYALFGGCSDSGSSCGAFYLTLTVGVGSRGWDVGAAPSCKPCLRG